MCVFGVYNSMGQPKASNQKSCIRLQAVIFFSCVYQEVNKLSIKTQEKNVNICIVFVLAPAPTDGGPPLCITCIIL